MATCDDDELDAWEDEDKFAIYRLYHVMGLKDGLNAVGVTKNWTKKGLQRVLTRHIKIAEDNPGQHRRFYRQLKLDQILYMVEKVVSYPNLTDCVSHMAMMFAWDQERPHFLVPETQRKKIASVGNGLKPSISVRRGYR